jgi:uncharacterized protein (TIGR02145 family)
MKKFYIALLLSLSSIGYSQAPCPGLDSLNYSGQWYHTVQIGPQCWLKENLNVGIMKPAVKDQFNNDTIEKFCYNNDPAMCDIYGGLYQWREAMQYTMKLSSRGICPIGWHVPTKADFGKLSKAVGGNAYVLKKIGQGGGTDTSGFSAMLSGLNQYTTFGYLGINADMWCSDNINVNGFSGIYTEIWNDSLVIYGRNNPVAFGLSVRCIKDDSVLLLQAPYGIENWQVGSSHNIAWGGNLINKKIQIDYTTDNGISWLKISASTLAPDGNFNWTIPNTPSENCKVKITDLNNPSSYSISDSSFTINTGCPGGSTVMHGGKLYKTLMLGNQCWFKENLNIGTMIPGIQTANTNDTIEKYCYNNDTANCTKYGGLYTYSEMKEWDICPTFWHLGILENISLDVLHDGNSLKEIGQGSGFGTGTNTTGFSGLLAGNRNYDGSFSRLDTAGWFPISAQFNPASVFANLLWFSNSDIGLTDHFGITQGGSFRCVRDDIGPLLLRSPIGGEQWKVGSIQKIRWTFSEVINIKIDYSTDNGTNWINIIASVPTSAGSYSWTIPSTPSNYCKVRISSVNNPDTNNVSTKTFRIYQVSFTSCPGIPTVIYGGLTYNTAAIGNQCWLKENLNIGTMINGNQNEFDNGIIEKYCYNNDTANCATFGAYYQWNEAMQYRSTEGIKGICPTGWHIPTNNEFTTLMSAVNNNGNDLKDLGQGSDLGAGTNASGFSAILSGFRQTDGTFYPIGYYSNFWGSTRTDTLKSFGISLTNYDNSVYLGGNASVGYGLSIRCINDSTVSELPVELTLFTASIINKNVKLNWSTATEINTSAFEIERKQANSNSWLKIASIKASGNSTSPKQYSFSDKNVNVCKYSYRLKMSDLDGASKYSNIINIEIAPPAKFELLNAYPNPWNPITTIRYQVPINILVTIKVFNALGREVSILVNEIKPAGSYEITFNAKGLSSGTYYYQLKAGSFVETKKIILIK